MFIFSKYLFCTKFSYVSNRSEIFLLYFFSGLKSFHIAYIHFRLSFSLRSLQRKKFYNCCPIVIFLAVACRLLFEASTSKKRGEEHTSGWRDGVNVLGLGPSCCRIQDTRNNKDQKNIGKFGSVILFSMICSQI